MKKIVILGLLIIGLNGSIFGYDIDKERGYWVGMDSEKYHVFDNQLAQKLGKFFRGIGAEAVVDFGCGMGTYVHTIQQMGIECKGFDGNPDTVALTQGLGEVLELTEPQDLGRKFDWVLSLEVGEHIPPQHEKVFIENLVRHAKEGIVLSWALKGQPGPGHVNTQDNDYIREKMAKYGFVTDKIAEKMLRNSCDVHWFRATLMVFRKKR